MNNARAASNTSTSDPSAAAAVGGSGDDVDLIAQMSGSLVVPSRPKAGPNAAATKIDNIPGIKVVAGAEKELINKPSVALKQSASEKKKVRSFWVVKFRQFLFGL